LIEGWQLESDDIKCITNDIIKNQKFIKEYGKCEKNILKEAEGNRVRTEKDTN
jgi:hypothetical protein